MFFAITFVLCALFAYSMGVTSNGMTSPRQAFNVWTGPFSAVLGAIIGLVTALFTGAALGGTLFSGAVIGLVAGLLGLGLARRKRHRN